LRTDATIACWGQYGAYPAPPTGSFASVDTGYSHACAVRVDRTVVCWGADFDGTPPAGTFASVSAGDDFVCGVRSDGTLACWGANVVVHHATPPTGTFRSVSAAPLFACGLRTDGTITCWGDNSPGTPPGGAFASVSAGDGFACGVRTDGTITCWGDNSSGQATPPAGTFASVSAGYGFACGVRTDSTVACWGKNSSGEATPPVADAAGADASVIPDLAPVLPLDGGACPWPASLTSSNDASTIGCWAHINTNVCEIPAGDVVDSHGTILGPDGTPVADASCQHSCIASEYLVWCMGDETSSSPFTVPEPDSSLGCRVLAGPTAALTAYFCCPCGPGQ